MKRQTGFTLLEIVVAVAILGAGVGMAMQIFSSGLNNVRRIELAHRAMTHAENIMNEILTDSTVVGPQEFSGDLDEEFAYTASIEYWEPPASNFEIQFEERPVQLLRVVVEVHFLNDRYGKKYRAVTLKSVAQDPESLGGPSDPAEAIRQLFGNSQ